MIQKSAILGGLYDLPSTNAAANTMLNLYPEVIMGDQGKSPAYLQKVPGTRLHSEYGTGPIRGMYTMRDNLYIVSGETLYRRLADGTVSNLGSVLGNQPVVMADNGIQIFIASYPNGYIFNTQTGILAIISNENFVGCTVVTFLNGYFIYNESNTGRFWVTELYDGSQIDPTNFATEEASPDYLVSLIANKNELWLFSETTTAVWYNSGDVDFPFAQVSGALSEIGCISPYSISKIANSLIWLGVDPRGGPIVYQTSGYLPNRISTHSIEYLLQSLTSIKDAVSYTYQENGHYFYVLNFPNSNLTLAYDLSTQLWHQRGQLSNGQTIKQNFNSFCYYQNLKLVGDDVNGKVYELTQQEPKYYNGVMQWMRRWRALPTGANTLLRTAQHSLQVDMQSGVGLTLGQGDNPQVMLRFSDDGGHTWSNEYWASLGKIGEYGVRVIWRRLGLTTKLRDRVYEISGTDPVPIVILGAQVNMEMTYA